MKGFIHWLQLLAALSSLIANFVRMVDVIIRTGWV